MRYSYLSVAITALTQLSEAAPAVSSERWTLYDTGSSEYRYTVHIPDRTTRKLDPLPEPWPMVLSLSGSGACGDASKAVEVSQWDGTPRRIAQYYGGNITTSRQIAAEELLVVTPVCNPVAVEKENTWNISAFSTIIEEVAANYPVDTTRVYITAYSMGCWAVVPTLLEYPQTFAAAVCSSGSTSAPTKELATISHIPLAVYYGELDREDLKQQILDAKKRYDAMAPSTMAAIPVNGSVTNMTVVYVAGADHGDMTDRPWDEDVVTNGHSGALSWLITHQRGNATNTTAVANATSASSVLRSAAVSTSACFLGAC